MKKAVIAIGLVALLGFGTAAYAHMMGGGYGMMGPGYGMMGPGYGHMWGGAAGKDTRKFFEETADLRREMNEKMFDYREAYWSGDTEKAETLEKEITALRDKIHEKGGFGPGSGFCGGPYSR